MKKKKAEPIYSLTLKGALAVALPEEYAILAMDAIELQLYRQKANAIVFEDDGGTFVEVQKDENND